MNKIRYPREIHEPALVRAFLLPQRQSRYLELLANPKRRRDVTRELAHFKHIDSRWIVPLKPSLLHTAGILEYLKSHEAPDMCYAISEDHYLDGTEMPLLAALKEIVGRGIGTFLSCVPGKLAYFEDEDGRCILAREK
ncbi:MAG TPA: hypothetical protein VJP87_04300 [Candidatus Acidoferrales bacterium]|nr:hypothetical protein [Candidatus Acidoferrales bacterium]